MLLRDLAIAFRVLSKSPLFALTAVITIALGLGASTAIFSVTHDVLLRPLPYKDPNRLVIAGMELRQRHVRNLQFSNADFIDLRDGTKSAFADMAGVFTFRNVIPQEDGTPEEVRMAIATTNLFRVLGARIAVGRDFYDDDGVPDPAVPSGAPGQQAPAAQPAQPAPPRLPLVAILSYEYFQRRYGGNAAVLGHTMPAGPGQASILVVGVLAPGMRLYFPPEADEQAEPDVWIANRLAYDAANRNNFSIRPVGRLKPGVSLQQAQAAADNVAAEGRKNFPIDQTAGYYINVEPMREHLVSEARPAILALMGSTIFLLLIASANVANLLLVRASLRERELAVRSALGASRWRLLRPLLAEAFLLATAGALVGLALAWMGLRELRGLLPAWRASKPGVSTILRGSSRNAALFGGSTLRNAVVMVEVALSFVLLVGSGLMFRSFLELQRIDPGFDPHRLLTFQVAGTPGAPGEKPEQRAVLIRQIHDRLSAIPGVQSVTASTPFPLAGGYFPIRWGTEEALADAGKFQAVDNQIVLPGYFETMRVPLLAGRTFTDDDNLPKRNVVVVDEFLAKKAYPGQSAVGKRILIRVRTPEPEWVEVIGVVAHQHESSLAVPGREQVYFADAFLDSGAVNSWAIRTGSDPEQYASAVRAAIKDVDPHLLVTEMQPVDALVDKAQAGTRFSLLLVGVFAVIAGVLAGVGLYAVLATAVRQRTAEIGVRMAMGAQPAKIFRLVVGQGFRLSAIGIGAGLIAAFLLTRLMRAMLVGVQATDPVTFGVVAIAFLLIAAVASWVPALRAAALDPVRALREE